MDNTSMLISILEEWNNPNYLKDTGASNGWYSLWCRLCGKKGERVIESYYNANFRGTRDSWICDKCEKEEVNNG